MSRSMYEEAKNQFTEDELFEIDFVLFNKYIEWKDDQERRDTKRNLKSYNDGKVIKQMFNVILDLMDTCNENDRIIKIRDMKIKELESKVNQKERLEKLVDNFGVAE